jgi:hypothetical protein
VHIATTVYQVCGAQASAFARIGGERSVVVYLRPPLPGYAIGGGPLRSDLVPSRSLPARVADLSFALEPMS